MQTLMRLFNALSKSDSKLLTYVSAADPVHIRRNSMQRKHCSAQQTRMLLSANYPALLLLSILLATMPSAAASSRSLTQSAASLFDQISLDLAPYKEKGISASMIQGVYCGIRDPGFRVQIINQEVFIVGEVQGFQSRNRNIKLALVDVASSYGALPDVDFVIGTYDWTATTVRSMPEFEAGGPVLAQVDTTARFLSGSAPPAATHFCTLLNATACPT